mgnify:CR=1 FL=1
MLSNDSFNTSSFMVYPNPANDKVFIGSCTNSRIEDLRSAAKVVERIGKRVADHVKLALVVPGSGLVKAQAEKEAEIAALVALKKYLEDQKVLRLPIN